MRAIIRHSPVRISPGSICWPPANCPLSPAGQWERPEDHLGDMTNPVPTPSTGTAVAILVGALALAVWARWE